MLGFYFNKYRSQSVFYLEFRLTFNEWIRANYSPEDAELSITKVNWDAWVTTPGPIPAILDFSTPESLDFATLAVDYINLKGDASPANFTDYKKTNNSNLKSIFLDKLVSLSNFVTPKILARIDADLNVTLDINPEVGQRWFPLSIQLTYNVVLPTAKKYVQSIGRQKYIIPVYTALVRNGLRNIAYQWFNERKDFYHPIAAAKIRSIIFSTMSVESFADEVNPSFLQ